MSSFKVQFAVAASAQDTFDFCRQAIAESGLQVLEANPPQIACKEASATKLNAWGGVAQAVTMQVNVEKAGNNQAVVSINGSVPGWFPGHADSRVGALQNSIIVVAKRNANSQNLGDPKPMLGKAEGKMTDELERLSNLHKSGMLTAEEFQKAKARLLG